MNIESWKQAWEMKKIGFHKNKPHPLLLKYCANFGLEKGCRIFLPLCGKTLDISWLLSQGYQVVGVEVSQLAVEELFLELGLEATVKKHEDHLVYIAENINIFVGDMFYLSSEVLGHVDAIYDRAALVALPKKLRTKYTKLLIEITDAAPQLLITFEYDQSLKTGPPYSIDADEVNSHYHDVYKLNLLESISLPGGLKGSRVASENIWLLKRWA